MRRWAFKLAAAVSLLLFVTVIALWIRSDSTRDAMRFKWRGRTYAVASEFGRIGIDNRPELDDFRAKQMQDMRQLQAEERAAFANWKKTRYGSDLDVVTGATRKMTAVYRQPLPSLVQHRIHLSVIALLASILPVRWLWRWHRRQVRVAAGLCGDCGYDLRASPQRCPECGTVPTKPTT